MFACGGIVDVTQETSVSYRHELFEHTSKKFALLHDALIKAEDFKDYHSVGRYRELMSFEDDIASISSVVLIILEADGALVELGLYCSRINYLKKLVVVVDEQLYNVDADSFIALGPLKYLTDNNNALVLTHRFPSELNQFQSDIDDLCSSLDERRSKSDGKIRFNAEDTKHVALLVAELIRVFYPILVGEIEECLILLGIEYEQSRIHQLLYVLKRLGYITSILKSDNLFYCPQNESLKFATFGKREDGKVFDTSSVTIAMRELFTTDNSVMSKRRKSALTRYSEVYSGN